jgi:phosphatidate cytidylyltransferase
MPQNLLKRIITSFFLLSILFIINFSNTYIFISSILILGLIICFEANKLFLKTIGSNTLKNTGNLNKLNIRFLTLNIITFCYIFFIFCKYSYIIHLTLGPVFFLYVISICFFTDIGGYVFGKIIGGKKLTNISPNKTISGTIGSFILGVFPLIIFAKLGYLNLEFNLKNILYVFLVSLTSQLGDLFVSYFKRKAKVKDTGKILPGHGGVLDRLDGIIFAIPFSYLLLKFI